MTSWRLSRGLSYNRLGFFSQDTHHYHARELMARSSIDYCFSSIARIKRVPPVTQLRDRSLGHAKDPSNLNKGLSRSGTMLSDLGRETAFSQCYRLKLPELSESQGHDVLIFEELCIDVPY